MNHELIRVLLCTYQGESFLAEQLDSVLNQDYPAIEIHVFDDCSIDNTVNIVEEYSRNYDNVFLYRNNINLGFLKNFENAISSTSGAYIALCDQDDIWHPEKLKVSMEEIKILEEKSPNTPALVHTDLLLIDDLANVSEASFFDKKKINLSPEKSINAILGHCGVMGNTILMNSLLVEMALPFPVGLKYHDYWLALVNELFGVRKTIHKALVQYRIHDRNISNNNKLINDKVRILDWGNRDYLLPFMEDHRELAIRYLIDEYNLQLEDKLLISQFHEYLIFKHGRFSHFMFLLNNNLLKNSFSYRISVLFRIMLTKRYSKK